MAGHSHWANIARHKGVVDAKRGKLFSKLSRYIIIAARNGGGDPTMNLPLRYAIDKARSYSCPKDNIERSIKKGTGELGAESFVEVMYEGYAPHGVALLIETATDNPTRTVAHVRNIIGNNGGKFGATGSVSFQFQKMGVFRLDPAGIDQDELELAMIDHGLEEMGESTGEKGEPQLLLRCAFENFGRLQEALEARRIAPLSAEHEYLCTVPTELPEPQATDALVLIDKLEQEEDVQRVFHSLA